jgi:hypothetical protein
MSCRFNATGELTYLKQHDKLSSNITGVTINNETSYLDSFLSVAGGAATFNVCGATDNPLGIPLGKGTSGNYAATKGNTIYLGEKFFMSNGYSSSCDCRAKTILHEYFHLSAVSKSGENLEHGVGNLASGILDQAAGGNFKAQIDSWCKCCQ